MKVEGRTSTGFCYSVDDGWVDDYEIMEDIQSMTDGNSLAMIKVVNKILGPEQTKNLKDHVRKDGKVSSSDMDREVTEIMQGTSAGKNS